MLRNYLKIAFKVFLRRKFFTFTSLFGISFTLLVLMTATAAFDHIFGPLPPETKLDRSLVVIKARISGPRGSRSGTAGYKLLDQCARPLSGAETVSLHSLFSSVSAYRDGERISLFMKRTDGQFWRVYDFRFLEGGPFTVEDEKNASFVAVINDAVRRRYFGGEPAIGRTMEVDGQRFRVVGVVENVPIFRFLPFADIWVPISTSKSDAYKSELVGSFMATVLARDRADLPSIRREYAERVATVSLPDPKVFDRLQSGAETFFESFAREFFGWGAEEGRAAGLLAVIFGLMVLFMVLPTINLVNLNVSRIMERASEIGVRKAFGASRRNLVGQFVVENVLLCLAGGALGFVLSTLSLRVLSLSGVVPYAQFHMNHRVFFYGLALATFFGLFSGVYPAWKMSRLHPVEALRGGSR